MKEHIEHGVIKVIELVGVSHKSFDDAVNEAITGASRTIEGISGVEVVKFTARVSDKKITEYHANVKLAFAVKP